MLSSYMNRHTTILITTMKFLSPERIIFSEKRGSLRIWDISTDEFARHYDYHYSLVDDITVSPDGSEFAVARAGLSIAIQNFADKSLVAERWISGECNEDHLHSICYAMTKDLQILDRIRRNLSPSQFRKFEGAL